MELVAINPVAVYGPVLGTELELSTSILLIKRLLTGQVPGLPRVSFGVVDVRDVADLHIRAMTSLEAAGERFLCISGQPIWIKDMALTLRERLREKAHKVPMRELPDFMIRIVSFWDEQAALIVPELGRKKMVDCEKARRVLGWEPRSAEECIIATAESLIKRGLVKI